MLEVPNEKAEVVSNATIYAVKILNEVQLLPRKILALIQIHFSINQIILKFLTFHLKTTQLILM